MLAMQHGKSRKVCSKPQMLWCLHSSLAEPDILLCHLLHLQPQQLTVAELRQDYPKSSRSFEAAIAAHNALDTLMKRQREYWLGSTSALHEGKHFSLNGCQCRQY